jgi:2-iminobutanoate/2-iminopropanoate deaminase
MAERPERPYSPVVRAGDWLVCAGQIGLHDGHLADGGLKGELTQAVANLRTVLEGEGARLDQVVKTTVFLAHISDYDAMNEAYLAAFGPHRPARTAVAVSALPLGAMVEVEAWAYVPLPAS